jgi:hypothetical protein
MERLLPHCRRDNLGLPEDEDAFDAIPTKSTWLVPTFCCNNETLMEMVLLHASVGRRLRYVHALLAAGADPNALGSYGTLEPLYLVARGLRDDDMPDRDDIIELLVSNGARLLRDDDAAAADIVRAVRARPSWSCPVCDERANGRCGADRPRRSGLGNAVGAESIGRQASAAKPIDGARRAPSSLDAEWGNVRISSFASWCGGARADGCP